MLQQSLKLKVSELVEVRSLSEILSTLDRNGCLDELPFMPQMMQYCGQQLRVRKRAHKLCDTAHGTGARSMTTAVFLETVQCDGKAFGGCEMGCQILWKEAWLKRIGTAASTTAPATCLEADIWTAAKRREADEDVYSCQATKMLEATRPLPRWKPGQYIEDYTSGNAPLSQILSGLLYVIYSNLVNSGLGFGSALRWTYDAWQEIRGGFPYPDRAGLLPKGKRTPTAALDLERGDLVRIRPYAEILKTTDENLVNRGMSFHPEMVPYCGKKFRVRQRVRRIINERTGRLMDLKNPCIVLDGADCIGRYTRPLNCPRASNPYWREIWLERLEGEPESSACSASQTVDSR